MVDFTQLQYYSGTTTFKNTGVFDTSISFSGSVGAGAEGVFTASVILSENQVFSFAIVKYAELARKISGSTTQRWQLVSGYADMYVQTTAAGDTLGASMESIVNGTTVTFRAVLFNSTGASATITPTTFDIKYVTYTIAD